MPILKRKIYWNDKQLEFLGAKQPIRCFLGGRGSGKSTVLGGGDVLRLQSMPRAKFFLSSTTYAQLLTKTLPAMEAKWNEMGFIENIHYVVGKRPPAHFELPYQPPRKFENVISFFNGYCKELLSLDRPDLARGGSYQGGDVDEAALVHQDHFTKVLLLSVRGFRHRFSSHWYGNVNLFTSIPWKPTGFWILDYEEKARINPVDYKFVEASAYDNIAVLGADYIRRAEEELPYLEFQVEVMNRRIRKVEGAFYHKFDPVRHTYALQNVYGEGMRGIELAKQVDPNYDPTRHIAASFDFSGWFNCATVWQEGRIDRLRIAENCLQQFFVKDAEGKIAELVAKICTHYAEHKAKKVLIYGEPRGHDKRPDTYETIYEIIARHFRSYGWLVEIKVPPGQVKSQKERGEFMNELLSETNPAWPVLRFCETTCKDAIIAMQVTPTKGDGEKDKSSEKNRAFPQEHAPHFTDTIDYYIMQKHGWKLGGRLARGALTASFG